MLCVLSLDKAKQVVKQKKLQSNSSYAKSKTDEGTLVSHTICCTDCKI